jgi:hypothetical protein
MELVAVPNRTRAIRGNALVGKVETSGFNQARLTRSCKLQTIMANVYESPGHEGFRNDF